MDSNNFRKILADAPTDLLGYFKIYITILRSPSEYFQKLPGNTERNVQTAISFLFINLVLSILLPHASITTPDTEAIAAIRMDLLGLWRYAVGILILASLLSRYFVGMSLKRSITLIGFASVVFPVYSVINVVLGNWVGVSLYNLYTSVFYGLLSNTTELKHSLIVLFEKATVVSVVEVIVLGWWVYVLNVAICETHKKLSLKIRIYGLLRANAAYILVKGFVWGVMFVTIFWNMLSIYGDWQSVKASMASSSPNYGDIMKISNRICASKTIPPRLLYLAAINNAFAQTVLLFPKDRRLAEIKTKILNESHKDAAAALRKYITLKTDNRSDSRLFLYQNIEEQLDRAEKAHNDKAYFEAQQNWIVGVAETDIPFAIFP